MSRVSHAIPPPRSRPQSALPPLKSDDEPDLTVSGSRPSSATLLSRASPSSRSANRVRTRTRESSAKSSLGQFVGIQPWQSLRGLIASLVGLKISPDGNKQSQNENEDHNSGFEEDNEHTDDDQYQMTPEMNDISGSGNTLMSGITIQYGFQPIRTLPHTHGSIASVLYVPNASLFVTRDSNFIHLWKGGTRINKISTAPDTGRGKSKQKPKGSFAPQDRSGIIGITRWLYVESFRLYIVSSMRLELKILDLHFEELLCVSNPAVLSMHYVPSKGDLITGEVGSIRIRKIIKTTSMHKEVYSLQEKLVIKEGLEDQWVTFVYYDKLLDRIFAACDSDLYVYDYVTGERLDSYYAIHDLGITCVVFYEPFEYLITGGKDGTIKVWNARKYLMFDFHEHFNAITGMILLEKVCESSPGSYPLLLSSSMDGTLRMWNFETGQALYRVDTQEPCLGIDMLKQNHFYHYTPSSVQIWNVNRYSHTFAFFRSATAILRRVTHPLKTSARILVTVGDGSMKLLSPVNGTIIATGFPVHKDAFTRDVAYDMDQERLYAFNSNGEVVIYNTEMNPFKLEEIWNIAKYTPSEMVQCICGLTIYNLDSTLSPDSAMRLQFHVPGVPKFFLIAGNTAGQILDVQIHLEGRLEIISQAHIAAISQLLYDEKNGYLLTSASDGIKVWTISVSDSRANFTGKGNRRLQSPFVLSLSCIANIAIDAPDLKGVLLNVNSISQRLAIASNGVIGCVSYLHDGKLSVKGTDSDSADSITAIASASRLGLWATGSDTQSVKVWDSDGSLLREVQFNQAIQSISFANERGDLLVGLQDQISLICVQDYMPHGMLRNLLAMDDFEDDDVETSIAFDPQLDFWEYLYQTEADNIKTEDWHTTKEEYQDRSYIEDELEKLLALPDRRRVVAVKRRNRRIYLATEQAAFIHSLRMEREKARIQIEAQDNLKQIQEFIELASSEPNLVTCIEPSTPTGEQDTVISAGEVEAILLQQADNVAETTEEVSDGNKEVAELTSGLANQADTQLLGDEHLVVYEQSTNLTEQSESVSPSARVSPSPSIKKKSKPFWAQAAVLPNSTVMAEAVALPSFRRRKTFATAIKNRDEMNRLRESDDNIYKKSVSGFWSNASSQSSLGGDDPLSMKRIMSFDSRMMRRRGSSHDGTSSRYFQGERSLLLSEDLDEDEEYNDMLPDDPVFAANSISKSFDFRKAQPSVNFLSSRQHEEVMGRDYRDEVFDESMFADEVLQPPSSLKVRSPSRSKRRHSKSRSASERSLNERKVTKSPSRQKDQGDERNKEKSSVSPWHQTEEGQLQTTHALTSGNQGKKPEKIGKDMLQSKTKEQRNGQSMKADSLKPIKSTQTSTRLTEPKNASGKPPLERNTMFSTSDVNLHTEVPRQAIQSKFEAKEVEEASKFVWDLMRKMDQTRPGSPNNESESTQGQRAANVDAEVPNKLKELAVNFNQALKEGSVNQIEQASRALLLLYKSFGTDMENAQDIFLQGHVDQMNHAMPEVRAAMCSNSVKFRIANENLLSALIYALADESPLVRKAAMDALAQMGITSRESLHTAMMAMNMIPGQSYRNRDEYLDHLQMQLNQSGRSNKFSNISQVNQWLYAQPSSAQHNTSVIIPRSSSYMDHLAGKFFIPDSHDEKGLEAFRAMHTWEALLGALDPRHDTEPKKKIIDKRLVSRRQILLMKYGRDSGFASVAGMRQATPAEIALRSVRTITAGKQSCTRSYALLLSQMGRPYTEQTSRSRKKPMTAFSQLTLRPNTHHFSVRNCKEGRDIFPPL